MKSSKIDPKKIAERKNIESAPRKLSGGESLLAEESLIFKMIEEKESQENTTESTSHFSGEEDSSIKSDSQESGYESEDMMFGIDDLNISEEATKERAKARKKEFLKNAEKSSHSSESDNEDPFKDVSSDEYDSQEEDLMFELDDVPSYEAEKPKAQNVVNKGQDKDRGNSK